MRKATPSPSRPRAAEPRGARTGGEERREGGGEARRIRTRGSGSDWFKLKEADPAMAIVIGQSRSAPSLSHRASLRGRVGPESACAVELLRDKT